MKFLQIRIVSVILMLWFNQPSRGQSSQDLENAVEFALDQLLKDDTIFWKNHQILGTSNSYIEVGNTTDCC